MTSPSMLLLCAGAAAGLASVWSLAGLSETSSLRSSPRVLAAAAVGLLGAATVYGLAPSEVRGELLLPGLFALASSLALVGGAAKLESALHERQGSRAARRAGGLVIGTFWGILAVGVTSLELVLRSLLHARFGWAYMLPLVAAALVVFARRVGLAGAGALGLGRRGLGLAAFGLLLLVGARALVRPLPTARAALPVPSASPSLPSLAESASLAPAPSVVEPAAAPSSLASSAPSPAAPPGAVLASSAPSPLASSAPSPPAAGSAGKLQVESVSTRGMLEADVRGGVERRFDRLQACLDDPKHQQSGSLSLKVGVDQAGSVNYSKATGGELVGTPLAVCLLPVFYKMGFAAPGSSGAYFEITLRSPPP